MGRGSHRDEKMSDDLKLFSSPANIPGVGRFCVLQDPQGAVICAITYEQK